MSETWASESTTSSCEKEGQGLWGIKAFRQSILKGTKEGGYAVAATLRRPSKVKGSPPVVGCELGKHPQKRERKRRDIELEQ